MVLYSRSLPRLHLEQRKKECARKRGRVRDLAGINNPNGRLYRDGG